MKALSHTYRHAWRAGLKTTYYLRTLGASQIEKATVTMPASAQAAPEPSPEAAQACSIDAMINGTECEACQ